MLRFPPVVLLFATETKVSQYTGALTVYTGCMASGKSAMLLHRVRFLRERGDLVTVSVPSSVDAKRTYSESRIGEAEYALRIHDERDITHWMRREREILAIDEAQDAEPWIAREIERLLERGRTIIVAGRDTDFRGEPFPIIEALRPLADSYTMLYAVCVKCGRKAERSQRLVDSKPAPWDSPIRERGSEFGETYEPRCLVHHEVPGKPPMIK